LPVLGFLSQRNTTRTALQAITIQQVPKKDTIVHFNKATTPGIVNHQPRRRKAAPAQETQVRPHFRGMWESADALLLQVQIACRKHGMPPNVLYIEHQPSNRRDLS
jgi:hypothetical protein